VSTTERWRRAKGGRTPKLMLPRWTGKCGACGKAIGGCIRVLVQRNTLPRTHIGDEITVWSEYRTAEIETFYTHYE
jgi:hypothetical protein